MDMNVRSGIFGFFIAVWIFSLSLSLLMPAELGAEERVHTVQKGETVYSISRAYGIDRDELMRLNGVSDPTKLQTGQRLRIPGSGTPEPAYTEYRVVRGDTLYGLARRYRAAVDAIAAANAIPLDHVLKPGDVLRIPPAGAAVPAPAAKAEEIPPQPASRAASAVPAAPAVPAAEPRAVVPETVDAAVRWPVAAKEVSYMTGKLSGVMLTGGRTEPVKSLTQGTVISAGPYRGFGRVAIVQVSGGYLYVYGGCESLSVKEGDKVVPGTELGRLGIDALSEKPQMFFLVYRNNIPVDPAKAPRS
jgi:murein DD-endopeptidase MepM/ murein hydrolase activator NlpD